MHRNRESRITGSRPLRHLMRILPCAVICVVGGCGGGGGGVGFADGQSPDPVVVDYPIAYVKRPFPEDQPDRRRLNTFDVGADLYLRDRAVTGAPERNITAAITQGQGDVRDVDVSFDGRRLLFAARGPFIEGAGDDEQPTWNIWEYDLDEQSLRRVIPADITAEAGQDVAPHYLPDGRIVFSSTRQRQSGAVLLDEGKPQFSALDEQRREPAFVLHVMNADGSDIHQISFNQSHDMDPAVLASGEIVFSRWDNAGADRGAALYTIRPDGRHLRLLYGADSHLTGTAGARVQFLQPRPLLDGRLSALLAPFTGTDGGGNVVAVDSDEYLNSAQPVAANAGVLSGPGQSAVTVNDVRTDTAPSPGGRYASAYPLNDGTGRYLMSWTPCRLLEDTLTVPCTEQALAAPDAFPAPPLYGLWIYDPADETQRPLLTPEEGIMYTDAVSAAPQALPAVLIDGTDARALSLRPSLLAENAGLVHIRSVYDVDGTDVTADGIANLADPALTRAAQRPARFLRIVKAVSIPDDSVRDVPNSAFGRSARQGMREIVGYVPVEPDGSVMFEVPADVAFAVSVVDAAGRRIGPRHQNWLQVRAGEILECNGCHDPASGLSHGRDEAFDSVWAGAATTGQPFPHTDPALFADFGETMAEVRSRISCTTDCASLLPSMDVSYTDVWTDPATAGRAPDDPFSYRYSDLSTTAPSTAQCEAQWSPRCRGVISYETHIQPLWTLPRSLLDQDGVTVLEDHTCTACHSERDAAGALRVPAAQLDLADGPSAEQPDQQNSYRELLFPDNAQELVSGALQDILVETGTDPVTGDPILEPVAVPAVISTAGAAASAAFFSVFDAGGSHAGWLTPAELRLLAEWVDIGGQYYNNPFDVPVN